MSNLNITPQTVFLTSGEAVTFAATNAQGQPVNANWTLNPAAIGTLETPVTSGSSTATPAAASATYVAPPLVASAQTVAIVASTATESASAAICLTPIAIVPAHVILTPNQSQQFLAIVTTASVPAPVATEKITWVLSPPLGSLDDTGMYKAPRQLSESTTVNVIATTPTPGNRAVATISLAAPPWQGLGVNILGMYLLLVFSVVFLMVGLWPPALPSPDTAKANRIEVEKALEEKTISLQNAEVAAAKALEEKKTALEKSNPASPSGTPAKSEEIAAASEAANAKAAAAQYALERARDDRRFAEKDLNKKREDEDKVNRTGVDTWLAGNINRELDLIWLVLLAGCLGSFLHVAQSYSEYIGNRAIKSSWAWWYSFRPFIGAGLALVFYACMRGGFMAVATGSNAKASELNPFGLVAIGALAGMFSKAATIKLGEVFDNLFKSDKAKETKDKLDASSESPSQPAGKPPAGGSASTATQ